ncbi:integral membrane sensor signal transduction histidine kinase [Anabaenopsis circularis NIES-21]|uniref:histidine kinase n=2 Tax=Nostocales TaxID=1161 RepID=A0A1Z4GJ87_9CYAN|nr:HAMP domain-containing sensor histidine kinase [Nostoc cycadae]BAY17567.1 integral membrane sensor signal transduction histidine kinase [Anabaenopsis circularis NIES-21]GBE91128.1 two-component sensor histidine kinase [Nostoc cycadae WK-1]
MNFAGNLSRKLVEFFVVRIDPASLHFRLTVGIIMIVTFGLSSFTIWAGWEIRQFLMIAHQNYGMADDAQLLTMIQSLGIMGVCSLTTTIVLTALFIKRSLLPLQQINQWAETCTNELIPHQLGLNQTPSEIQELAQTWMEFLTRLSEAKEQQRQLFSDLAHELRTPLSMVYGYLQRSLQRSHNLAASQKETLEMAVSDAERMNYILQDLLYLARADNSTIPCPWETEPLLLNDLLTAIAEITEKFHHRLIQVEIPPFPIKVKAERHQLMQILSHLIANAVKYSDVGEPITLQLTQANGWAMIQVSDKGCGIPLLEQSRIFEPFYRVDASRTRSTGGTGMGLCIVKRLVECIGGTIELRSELGNGSIFILKLPTLLGGNR